MLKLRREIEINEMRLYRNVTTTKIMNDYAIHSNLILNEH